MQVDEGGVWLTEAERYFFVAMIIELNYKHAFRLLGTTQDNQRDLGKMLEVSERIDP